MFSAGGPHLHLLPLCGLEAGTAVPSRDPGDHAPGTYVQIRNLHGPGLPTAPGLKWAVPTSQAREGAGQSLLCSAHRGVCLRQVGRNTLQQIWRQRCQKPPVITKYGTEMIPSENCDDYLPFCEMTTAHILFSLEYRFPIEKNKYS